MARRFSAAPPRSLCVAVSIVNLAFALFVLAGTRAAPTALPAVAVFCFVSWMMFRLSKLGAVVGESGLRISTVSRTIEVPWKDVDLVEILPGDLRTTDAAYLKSRDGRLYRIVG